MNKIKVSKGLSFEKDEYQLKYDWKCGCQAGNGGVVFSKKGNYKTAFFEAFPDNPSCFIRGEGENVEQAEEEAWKKYQKILICDHEMERRGRTDGYAYCKHCSYSSTVFEPLTKCCKCGKSTAYAEDHRGKWYCKKHSRNMPKNPDKEYSRLLGKDNNRLPRKYKKQLKKGAEIKFRMAGFKGPVAMRYKVLLKFSCDDHYISILFNKERDNLLKLIVLERKAKRLKQKLKNRAK